MKKTCSVVGCNVGRATEDLLFCTMDRRRWVDLCVELGIKEREVSKEVLNEILRRFQNNEPIEVE